MTRLSPTPVSTQQFTYNPATRTLVAELSEVRLSRLFDDAADVGLVLRSERTGALVTFGLAHEEYDPAEGELMWLSLRPLDGPDPELEVRLYND